MASKARLSNEQIVELGKRLWDLTNDWIEKDDGWKYSEEIHGVKMYKRHVPAIAGFHEAGTVIKGVGFVPHATVEEFVDLVLDPVKRTIWDTAEFYDKIAEIDEHTDVCHVGVPGWGPVSAREFVSVRRSRFDHENGWYNACQVTIDYPTDGREHKSKNFVRGKLLPSCWRFVQQEGGCMTYYISGVNLGGWVPQSIVDGAVYSNTGKQFFPHIKKYFKEWIAKQNQETSEQTEEEKSAS